MTIDLDSGDGLFDRLGKLGQVIVVTNTYAGTTLPTDINDVMVEYDAGTNEERASVSNLLSSLASTQSAVGTIYSGVRDAATKTVIQMAHADNPLANLAIEDALTELIKQMNAAGPAETVLAPVVGSSVAYDAANVGNGKLAWTLNDGLGRTYRSVLPEVIEAVVEADGSSATVAGEASESTDRLDHRWPSGSGASQSLFPQDPETAGLLTNGGFETFTVANTPDDWTISVGTAGVNIFSEASLFYRGAKALRYLGDTTLCSITQALTGLSPRTPYCLHVATRVSAAPAAGVLTIDLWDGAAVIQDDNGANQTYAIDLTAETTSYAVKTTVFQLPAGTTTATLRVRMSTAIDAAKSLYIDSLSFGVEPTQLYDGGPALALFSGSTEWAEDDIIRLTTTNTFAGKFQELFFRLFGLPDLFLPDVDPGNTINDGLIA